MPFAHIRQTHWPLCLKSKVSSYTRARSQATIQLRDALRSYAKYIGHFALNPKLVATRARSQAIIHLRNELLLYAKHIGHFSCIKYKFTVLLVLGLKQSCNCEMNFSYTPNTLATLFKIQSL
jgi:hypothetical protein